MTDAPKTPATGPETPEDAARRLAAPAIATGFLPVAMHRYCDSAGNVQFWRLRAKHPNSDKWIRPMHWNGHAFVIGEPPAPPGGKLLYGLPALQDLGDDERVIVVEGESCVDALSRIGLIVVTSGGADSADAADWSALHGRHVLIWADNDLPGRRHAEAVTEKLRGIAASIEWIDLKPLRLPVKGDCVDWLAQHPNAEAEDVWALARIAPPVPRERAKLASSASASDEAPRVILLRGSDVEPLPVDWLWPGWIAAGKLHLIGGAPGTGKTTLAAGLAAIVTRGGQWPDGSRARIGSVVIWSGEDDNADTLIPRLCAAGADMDRVHIVDQVIERKTAYPFDPARDMDTLRDALWGISDVRVIVVDPVVAAVSGDSHKNAEVRRGLQPLVDLARRRGCAVLGITHFSKGTTGRDPLERITGSLAFGALARIVLVAAKQDADGDRPARRVLLRAKSNNGPDGGGFAYDLRQEPLPDYPDIEASRAVWGEAIDGTAREVLAVAEAHDDERTATGEAIGWLRETLAQGPIPAAEVMKLARLSGLSDKALRTARERLGIKPQRIGFGKGSSVQWGLPMPIPAQSEHTCPLPERASMGDEGIYGGDDGGVIEL